MSLKGSCEIPRIEEGNRNPNREVWESPCVHAGEDVNDVILSIELMAVAFTIKLLEVLLLPRRALLGQVRRL
jgi:hypothetical protein